jgi:hypothetical protein
MKILLLTLRAQLIDVRDGARSYSYFQSPADKRKLPIRSIELPADLQGIEGSNPATRQYLEWTPWGTPVNICFCPAINAIASQPYQRKLKALTNDNSRYSWRVSMTHEQERHWRSLSPWRRMWLALRCVPFTDLEPPQPPPSPEYIP